MAGQVLRLGEVHDVRRDVAQSLHGGLQNGLVVLTAELHAVASASDEAASERLLAIAARLDRRVLAVVVGVTRVVKAVA